MVVLRVVIRLFVLASLSFMSLEVQAAAPATINYQGYLTSNAGTAVDGSVTMLLSLYDVSSGGAALWQEVQTVTVSQGYFNIELGAITALTPSLFANQLYLGVQVGTDPEKTPRRPVSATGYSFRSGGTSSVQMIVNKITIYQTLASCANPGIPTFSATCGTVVCGTYTYACGTFLTAKCTGSYYYSCGGTCSSANTASQTCNNTVAGELVKP
jgi:hypothetical protein